ncbi:hypothetical protein [Lysobacter silvisoli]|uniref:Uncharacterized protein n=1 Tax=Lysobacter silvisoli TaxID=2293254 RepID=A0A371JX26_9GAMM|nr:hypothetical protein [Lysobacter silvisoli]RDZ26174.1 hypothetical protein DX914_18040 [Lysobacter silvisoli]
MLLLFGIALMFAPTVLGAAPIQVGPAWQTGRTAHYFQLVLLPWWQFMIMGLGISAVGAHLLLRMRKRRDRPDPDAGD